LWVLWRSASSMRSYRGPGPIGHDDRVFCTRGHARHGRHRPRAPCRHPPPRSGRSLSSGRRKPDPLAPSRPFPPGLGHSHNEKAHFLPPPARRSRVAGRADSGKARAGWGVLPEALRRLRSAVSKGALAQPPHRPRRPLAWPSRPPPLPLPATRLRRAGGGRSREPDRCKSDSPPGEGTSRRSFSEVPLRAGRMLPRPLRRVSPS
jgi:hypothetical protein